MSIDFDKEQLENDFADFTRKLRNQWYFKYDVLDDFSEIPAFRVKSNWHASKESWGSFIELPLGEVWNDISKIEAQGSNHPNLCKDEREALKTLPSDTSIVINWQIKDRLLLCEIGTTILLNQEYKKVKTQITEPLGW